MQGQIGVALRIRGFLQQVQEKLDARMHDGYIVRPTPLHQFSQGLKPRLQRVRLQNLTDQQGQCGHGSQARVQGHHSGEQSRADVLLRQRSTSWADEGRSRKESMRMGCSSVTVWK
jgi:hypothetical protein